MARGQALESTRPFSVVSTARRARSRLEEPGHHAAAGARPAVPPTLPNGHRAVNRRWRRPCPVSLPILTVRRTADSGAPVTFVGPQRPSAACRPSRVTARARSRPATVAAAAQVLLTPQELKVAGLAAAGLANKEIASQIGVSVRTVET